MGISFETEQLQICRSHYKKRSQRPDRLRTASTWNFLFNSRKNYL